ncbi:DUF2514 family protein [Pseudomonas abyssi]|uniref:DUF2514 domain-containing protein n=1 Tax=Pseudomonas abyssi TaxID=170540 RepID=A0A395RAE2_9PSED|nr:DUF2514 family protein [Halopseudomonas gallaeciensis]RGP57087.1 hypothetical protein ASB58_07080 [Halopseudomonas gallaeciensis]
MLSKYKLWLQIAGLLALVLLGFGVGWSWQGARWESKYIALGAEYAEARAAAEWQARSEETRRAAAVEGIRRDAKNKIQQAEADTAAANAAADSLRQQLAERTRRASADTCSDAGSQTARSTLILYSKLLDRADARAGELAAEADRRRVAGLACEAQYDSLSQRRD